MKILEICAVLVIVSCIAAVVINIHVNPRAALYAATTAVWAAITIMRG